MQNKVVRILITILIATGVFYFGYSFNPNLKNVNFSSNTSSDKVSVLIDDGKIVTGFANQDIPADATVFGLLQQVTSTNNIVLDYTPAAETSFNAVFIKKIGDKQNGEFGSYWQYWVNGEQPQVGADKFNLTGGETVLWTFRPSAM